MTDTHCNRHPNIPTTEKSRLLWTVESSMERKPSNVFIPTSWRLVSIVARAFVVLVSVSYVVILRDRWENGKTLSKSLTPGVDVWEDTSLVDKQPETKAATKPITATTVNTQYGEVWLLRHGEKDSIPLITESSSIERIQAMYELNYRGWDRANHLVSLIASGYWPRFGALFASRPATLDEIDSNYPDFARDSSGQSLVWREYQTLLPLSEFLSEPIQMEFSKGDTEAAGLELAKVATGNNKPTSARPFIVLVSWDHCSLPTLVVKELGCKEERCHRCWSDDRFGDVLHLNVSITTTTVTDTDQGRTLSQKSVVSSTILSMSGEAYPSDEYWYTFSKSKHSLEVSIEKSTPCAPSYCTNRPAARNLITCLCYENGNSRPLWTPIPNV